MSGLTKEQIFGADDIQRVKLNVPEWGGDIWVQGMNGAQRDRFEASIVQQKTEAKGFNLANIRARLCALTICDEQGVLMFSEKDIDALSRKSAVVLTKIFLVAQQLSGIGDAGVKELASGLDNPFDDSASA